MFSRIDLFGKSVLLNFNGKSKSRSSAGAWFSLIFFGFIAWSIYELGQDLINRKDPKTITSEFFEENPSPMIISPDTFNFAFGLQHPVTFAHYINESIYTVEVTLDRLIRVVKDDGTLDMKWNSTPLLFEICTKEHFGPLASKFENLELNSLYCLKKDQPELAQIRIQGVFESPIFEAVTAVIKQCNNKTSSCATSEKLQEMLAGGWFATYFTNLAIDPKNYSYPNVGYRDSFYTSMSNSYFKEVTLWLNHVEVTSDYGWITKEVKNDRFIKLDHAQEYTNFRSNLNSMLSFVIRVGKITTHYDRSYIKVQDVIAQANGFMSAGIMVGIILLMPYSNIKFYEGLINELFEVRTLKKGRKDKKFTRKRTKAITRIMLDGEKFDNFGNHESAAGSLFEKNGSKTDLSPDPVRKASKSRLSSHKTSDFGPLRNNLSPLPQTKHRSFIQKNRYSLSGDTKDMKFIKIDTSPNLKVEEIRSSQQRLSDPNLASTSSKIQPYSCYLLSDKPKKSEHPQTKILETFDIQSPGESFIASDNIIEKLKSKRSQEYPELSPKQVAVNINKNEEENLTSRKSEKKSEKEIDEDEINQRAELLPHQLTKDSSRINITFGEYIQSFFWRTERIKEKFGLLDEGVRRIKERLNIFNLLKKLREVDKLKLLLLENEQFVLFDALPNPELSFNTNDRKNIRSKSFSHNQLREAKFIADKRKYELVKHSYVDLKKKSESTMIDEKLIEIYDDIIDS